MNETNNDLTARSRDVPGYNRVAEHIREDIHRGVHQPGERLPTLRELAEKYGVSRSTVQTAVKQLEADGLLDVRQGSGVYVAPGKTEYNPTVPFAQQFREAGRDVRVAILGAGWVTPHDQTVEVLGIPRSEQVWTLCSADHLDGVPVLMELLEFPPALATPFLGDTRKQQSILSVLEHELGYGPLRIDVLRINLLSERFMSHNLGMPPGTVFYEIWRSISAGDKPLLTNCLAIRADRFLLTMQRLNASASPGGKRPGAEHRTMGETMHNRFSEMLS